MNRMTKWWLLTTLCFACYALLGIAVCLYTVEHWGVLNTLPVVVLLGFAMNAPVASAALVERHYKLKCTAYQLKIKEIESNSSTCCPKCTVPEEECPLMNNEL